ncbi:hypothetical protein D3C83_284360 [compost metagenome]
MAAEMQVRELETLFPLAPRRWAHIIRLEVTGQADYLAAHGAFPVDQYAFIKSQLELGQ